MVGEKHLRREIGRTLGISISNDVWSWLESQGDVARVLNGQEHVIKVISNLRYAMLIFASEKIQPQYSAFISNAEPLQEQDARYSRDKVLWMLAARDAASDSEVESFRYHVLRQRLVEVFEIEQSLFAGLGESVSSSLPTWWLANIPLPSEPVERLLRMPEGALPSVFASSLSLGISTEQILEKCEWQLLAYAVPTSTSDVMEERKLPITTGTHLERLRELSIRLARQYRWTEAQATTFVLTGITPKRRSISVWTERNERLGGLSVIHVVADPAVSPKLVADSYLEERKQLLGTRHRDLSEKHLTLAVFVASQPPNSSWSERMARWNDNYGARGWTYSQVANFAHDGLQAQRRLLRSEEPIVGSTTSKARVYGMSGEISRDESEEAPHVAAGTQ